MFDVNIIGMVSSFVNEPVKMAALFVLAYVAYDLLSDMCKRSNNKENENGNH